jgi:hypothetical protein
MRPHNHMISDIRYPNIGTSNGMTVTRVVSGDAQERRRCSREHTDTADTGRSGDFSPPHADQ